MTYTAQTFAELVDQELEADTAAALERLQTWSLKRLQEEGIKKT